MGVTIWHNPRCSKSRQTLALIEERGIRPEIREYLKHPPDPAELGRVLGLLGHGPRGLMRRGEDAYREHGLADESLDDATLIRAMVDNPVLIERPVVLANGKAAVGRPPESVLEIL